MFFKALDNHSILEVFAAFTMENTSQVETGQLKFQRQSL